MTVIGPCPNCEGRGYLVNFWGRDECLECHGEGYLELGPAGGMSPEKIEDSPGKGTD